MITSRNRRSDRAATREIPTGDRRTAVSVAVASLARLPRIARTYTEIRNSRSATQPTEVPAMTTTQAPTVIDVDETPAQPPGSDPIPVADVQVIGQPRRRTPAPVHSTVIALIAQAVWMVTVAIARPATWLALTGVGVVLLAGGLLVLSQTLSIMSRYK